MVVVNCSAWFSKQRSYITVNFCCCLLGFFPLTVLMFAIVFSYSQKDSDSV